MQLTCLFNFIFCMICKFSILLLGALICLSGNKQLCLFVVLFFFQTIYSFKTNNQQNVTNFIYKIHNSKVHQYGRINNKKVHFYEPHIYRSMSNKFYEINKSKINPLSHQMICHPCAHPYANN